MVKTQCIVLQTSVLALLLVCTNAKAQWSDPAVRSGASLPDNGDLDVSLAASGLYVKEIENVSDGATGVTRESLVWNYAIAQNFGLFGGHDIYGLWWDNPAGTELSFLAFGHEVGLRLLTGPHLAFEVAYLTHRIEYQWLDGQPYSIGGLHDHGFETAAVLHTEFARRLRLEGTLLGRFFAEPKNDTTSSYTDQLVFGFGFRAIFRILDNHELETNLRLLRVYRGPDRRAGTDEITWNALGKILWRLKVTKRLGFFTGAEASSSFWCGEIPMMEIKRSMINEPMAQATLGMFFSI